MNAPLGGMVLTETVSGAQDAPVAVQPLVAWPEYVGVTENDAVPLAGTAGGVTVNALGAEAVVVAGDVVTPEGVPLGEPMVKSGAPAPAMMLPSASRLSTTNVCVPVP